MNRPLPDVARRAVRLPFPGLAALLLPVLPVLLLPPAALPAQAGAPTKPRIERQADWDGATVEAMRSLPVQHGGREQPLAMHAAVALYAIHGRRDMKLDTDGDGRDDVTLEPTEWLLDVWCFPDQAADYPLFRIENVEVLDAIGIGHEGQKPTFEYVSYRTMMTPAGDGPSPAQKLLELAGRYVDIKAGQRSPVERHIVDSATQVRSYHDLHQQLAVLQSPFVLEGERLRAVFGGRDRASFGELLGSGAGFRDLVRTARDNVEDPGLGNTMAIANVLFELARFGTGGPALFPPAPGQAQEDQWLGLGDLVQAGLFGELPPSQAAMLGHLQAALLAQDQQVRQREMLAFRDNVVERARARGEFGTVELEAYYLSAAWSYKALHWFLLAILVVAAGWALPRSKWLWIAGIAATALPLGFLVLDIVLRCVIRGRPPILNLYDTFLFIAAVGVLAALVTEVVTRRRIALSVAPVFGALLIVLARAFEVEEAGDHLAVLQAVLDTNYYLATHVTAINMGYAAGVLASFLGLAWLAIRTLGIQRRDPAFQKSIVRATYGVTCFGLIFAVFGTIYGGVWANDSWGRFWGWDPKENGALLICLSQVALLHARMSGWVRDLGFCVWASLIGIVVAFSWFHVNLLEIGLHSYGFASSTEGTLLAYYYVQGGLTALGAAGVLWRQSVERTARLAAAQA